MSTKTSSAAVSRALTAAGFQRSQKSPSMIRGMSEYGQGFMTESRFDGTVLVEYSFGSFTRSTPEQIRPHLTKMAEALRVKGYVVDEHEGDPYARLTVSKPTTEG